MIAALLVAAALAQSPEEPWATVTTTHYRVHYPVDTAAWTLDAAARLDLVRERVAEVVGHNPDQVVDVVIMDPWARANGFAVPLARAPRMGVFPTAPDAGSGIGHYRLWAEDLLVHEDVHLVHLLRPARNPVARVLGEGLLGLPPIPLLVPAWVVEGYATLIEGRLTGLGRPNSDGRAQFLRMLAMDGQLPTYDQLDRSGRWRSGSMRYLVGSAFLEWLEDRHGAGTLPAVWARMTAVELRTFDTAFQGVFGDTPAAMYARFVAELHHQAITMEAARPTDPDTLFQDTGGHTGAPAVSPDGTHIAVVIRGERGPPKLAVFEVEPDPETATEWWADQTALLEKDPEDFPAVPPRVFAQEPVHKRVHGGSIPVGPRWLDDTRVLFTVFGQDRQGDGSPDLFVWDTASGKTTRITKGAHLRDADVRGGVCVAVSNRYGLSALVEVDLETGAVTALQQPDPTVVIAQPRVSPDGDRVVFLKNVGGWQLWTMDLAEGTERQIPIHTSYQPLSATWTPDGAALIASMGKDSAIELYRVELGGVVGPVITSTRGGAWAPDVTPDGGEAFYLVPDYKGYDVHRAALDSRAPAIPSPATGVTPGAQRPPPPDAPPLVPTAPLAAPQRYGLGRQELRPLVGTMAGAPGTWLDVGMWMGDVVGRTEVLALAGFTQDTDEAMGLGGASLTWTLRRLPVHLMPLGFLQRDPVRLRWGGGLDTRWDHRWTGGHAQVQAGGWFEDVTSRGSAPASPTTGAVGAAARLRAAQRVWTGPVWWSGSVAPRLALTPHPQATTPVAHGTVTLAGGGGSTHGAVTGSGGRLIRGGSAEPDTNSSGSDAPSLHLGGLRPATTPGLTAQDHVWLAPLAPDTATGTAYDHLRVEVGFQRNTVRLFAARARMAVHCDDAPESPDCYAGPSLTAPGWTTVGVDARIASGAQPLARIPGVSLLGGVACLLEAADEGWQRRPCRARDDFSAWLALRWEPGRPNPYPTAPAEPDAIALP